MATDYYASLGVSADASNSEIKAAFRALAREHHPDATGGDSASEQRYKEISEAYAVLSDPQRRQQYDAARLGIGGFSASPFASTIEDIFETFFGGRGGTQTRQRTRAQHGESLEFELDLSLDEVVFGAKRTLTFDRYEACETCDGSGAEAGTSPEHCARCQGTGQVQETRRTVLGSLVTQYPCRACEATGWVTPHPCPSCRGAGRVASEVEVEVDVPGGIDQGDRMRLDGEGHAGMAGGSRGDLYVRFSVLADERFERLGDDLLTWAEIPMTTAALGGDVTIDTFDGELVVDVPSGTQSTAVFRLKGHGVPRRNGRGRGDLLVRAHVATPTKLNRKQKDLLRKLSEERGEDEKGGVRAALRRAFGSRER